MWTKFTENDWFVLFVKTNIEETIKQNLISTFGDKYIFYVPKKIMKERRGGKWKTVTKPLFKGYIIFKGNLQKEDYYLMNNINDVYYVLKNEKGPIPMLKDEIELLEKLLNNSENDSIGVSDIYMVGEDIYVENGPLQSLEGIIVSVNKRKGRAKVRLSVGGNEKLIDLSINFINHKNQTKENLLKLGGN